jgi:hypothetical protein
VRAQAVWQQILRKVISIFGSFKQTPVAVLEALDVHEPMLPGRKRRTIMSLDKQKQCLPRARALAEQMADEVDAAAPDEPSTASQLGVLDFSMATTRRLAAEAAQEANLYSTTGSHPATSSPAPAAQDRHSRERTT